MDEPKTPAERLAAEKAARPKSDISRGFASRRTKVFRCAIPALRESLGLTQSDVANVIGVTQSQVAYVENGHNLILATAIKLARFFGKPVEELWQPLSDDQPNPEA